MHASQPCAVPSSALKHNTSICCDCLLSAFVQLHILDRAMLVLSMAQPTDMTIHAMQVACNTTCHQAKPCTFNALVAQQVSQGQMQQQLSQIRAASKASDSSKVQAEVHHQAQLAELHQQLDLARQRSADLQAQHQQDLLQQLASAAAATADIHKHELEKLRNDYTASCHRQAAAMETLQQELVLLTQETERGMSNAAHKMSALHKASYSSQAELQQQLQQLRAEVTALQNDSTSVGNGKGAQEALMDICQQLDAAGCSGIGPLLREHQQLQAQVSCDSATHALTCTHQTLLRAVP